MKKKCLKFIRDSIANMNKGDFLIVSGELFLALDLGLITWDQYYQLKAELNAQNKIVWGLPGGDAND